MAGTELVFDGETVDVSCDREGDALIVTVGEKRLELTPAGDNLYSADFNGSRCLVGVVQHEGTYYIDIDSVLLEVNEPSEDGFADGAGGQLGEKDKIYAPMPGKIVKIMVALGDEVVEKQPMVIVEAMKMENQVNSRAKGKVKAIHFTAGDQVDTESPIIELELEE